jgi:hypothetical protein
MTRARRLCIMSFTAGGRDALELHNFAHNSLEYSVSLCRFAVTSLSPPFSRNQQTQTPSSRSRKIPHPCILPIVDPCTRRLGATRATMRRMHSCSDRKCHAGSSWDEKSPLTYSVRSPSCRRWVRSCASSVHATALHLSPRSPVACATVLHK